jgi:phosphatidylinositol alpha-1,6-mannosyltransferase
VDASRFHPDAAGTRRSELRRGASHWLLTVCRLVPHKGADRSLEVLAALIGLGFDAALFVAGEGPERAALEGAAARLGVAGRVRWLGRISEEELPALYASADVYLGLSREEGVEAEGFGLSFLEAAASGLPVVAGASGGTGASVAEGVTGYMVPPTDAGIAAERVGRLLADSGLAARLGAAGRARAVSEFGWARVAAALLASGSPAGVPAPGGS